jgi:drug/metabolite transporter (DMT)-like permease
MEQKRIVSAYLATIVAHIFWGFSFMASRTALNTGHVFLVLSHRFVLAFLVLSLLPLTGLVKLDLRGKPVLPLLLLGMTEPVIYFFGEQYGILHSSTIFSGVMVAMIPIVCTVAAAPILGERPTAGQLVFGAVSVAGVVILGLVSRNQGNLDWIGLVALLVAMSSAAAHTLLGRSMSARFTPFERTYTTMALAAAVFTALALIRCRGSAAAWLQPLSERPYLLSILFLGVCCSGVAYFLTSYTITHLPVARASVFTNLTTAVSVFAGAFFLREPLTWVGVVCCAAILVGIYGVQRSARKEGP